MERRHYGEIIFIIAVFWSLLFSTPSFPQKSHLYRIYQNYPDHFNWGRGVLSGVLLAGAVTTLYILSAPIYYSEEKASFHFTRSRDGSLRWFENQVRGLDKFGHVFSSSLFYQNIYFLSRWSGCNHKTATYSASSLTFAVMTGMEIHDAYYKRWGFTAGDFIANIVGILLPIGQQNIPFLQYIDYKFSYNFTAQRSAEYQIEDYSNMTFWLTANPAGLLKSERSSGLPAILKGINLALGVSITPYQPHQREIYLALDYNLKQLMHSDSAFLQHLITVIDRFHLPAPAIRVAPTHIGYGLFF
jgi:hypothetical protein